MAKRSPGVKTQEHKDSSALAWKGYEIPARWTKGEQLQVKRIESGYKISRPYEEEHLLIHNQWDANDFLGWWYARESHPLAR